MRSIGAEVCGHNKVNEEGNPQSGECYGKGCNQAQSAERATATEAEEGRGGWNAGNDCQELASMQRCFGKSVVLCNKYCGNTEDDVSAERGEQKFRDAKRVHCCA